MTEPTTSSTSSFLAMAQKVITPALVERHVWHNLFTRVFGYPFGAFFWAFTSFYLLSWFKWIGFLTCWSIVGFLFAMQYFRTCSMRLYVNWSEEVVLITGGAFGVGRKVVEELLDRYSPLKIIIFDVSPPTFKHERVAWYECDISSLDAVKENAEKVISEHGIPTILINNAGIVKGKTFLDEKEEDIQKVMGVNLMGPMWMTKVFLPRMLSTNKPGHIVNVASILGLTGCAYATDYCASKFGVVGFHESLRQELNQCNANIKMTLVYPGFINTGMFTNVDIQLKYACPPLEPEDVSQAIVDNLNKRTSADIKLPSYAKLLGPISRLLPIEIGDWVKDITHANQDLKHFTYSVSAISVAKSKKTE